MTFFQCNDFLPLFYFSRVGGGHKFYFQSIKGCVESFIFKYQYIIRHTWFFIWLNRFIIKSSLVLSGFLNSGKIYNWKKSSYTFKDLEDNPLGNLPRAWPRPPPFLHTDKEIHSTFDIPLINICIQWNCSVHVFYICKHVHTKSTYRVFTAIKCRSSNYIIGWKIICL